jgi:predicted nuclease of restriction endonuclease-like (RecB) superfamily
MKITKSKKNNLYTQVKSILEKAKDTAARAVNFSMVLAYWEIGRRIVEEEQKGRNRAEYGEKLIEDLSEKLSSEYGAGFSVANLKNFRQFYKAFPGDKKSYAPRSQSSKKDKKNNLPQKSYALRSQLSWTHYRLLMRVESEAARNYYLEEAVSQNWSSRVLERQINSHYFERLLSSKNKKALIKKSGTDSAKDKPTILDFVKDPYVLEFLSLKPHAAYYEADLETELINKLQLFMLELGKGFSFVERQKRISADGEHFYVDLVFYNYVLKCFVLIDLKVGKLTHQDIGQMDLYVRFFEDEIKQGTDNPTIGIILCAEKNEAIAKYSVLKESKQLFATKYKLHLPSERELVKELKFELEQLKRKKMK